jgi:chromosome segregation ATPase
MDLQSRLERLERAVGDQSETTDTTTKIPSEVISTANRKLSETQKSVDPTSIRFTTLANKHENLTRTVLHRDSAEVAKTQGLVRLNAIHAELAALDIENVEKELDKLKLLEPMVEKSRETFNKLSEEQEAMEGEHGAANNLMAELQDSINSLNSQLVGMTQGYAKEVREINDQFKRLEGKIVDRERQLEALDN